MERGKRKSPSQNCWDRDQKTISAVPPGLTHIPMRPLNHTNIWFPLLTKGTPSRLLFIQLALRSPFILCLHAAIPPPATLCAEATKNYSLFFNGLLDFNTCFNLLSSFFCKLYLNAQQMNIFLHLAFSAVLQVHLPYKFFLTVCQLLVNVF